MAKIGYALSSEEHTANALVDQAVMAENAGFDALWISDHYHPWNDEQGQSPFVWSVIGAIAHATRRIPLTTAVTCPTVRIHPAVIAQAAATAATMMPGRFGLGVGSGEALNEHILGAPWPAADVRLEMLSEAVEVIRDLWSGRTVSRRGRYYTVDRARIYSLPEELPPILVSGFGPASARLAGSIGDGFCSVKPDADLVGLFDSSGGTGKPKQGAVKMCWAPDEESARKTAHRLWSNNALPGELSQELPTPGHFEQASTLVTPEMIDSSIVLGPDPERHVAAIREFLDAGYTEVYVTQIGPDQEAFFSFYQREILPRFH
jgi:G6PDH family F420-dependent oxidoreductase